MSPEDKLIIQYSNYIKYDIEIIRFVSKLRDIIFKMINTFPAPDKALFVNLCKRLSFFLIKYQECKIQSTYQLLTGKSKSPELPQIKEYTASQVGKLVISDVEAAMDEISKKMAAFLMGLENKAEITAKFYNVEAERAWTDPKFCTIFLDALESYITLLRSKPENMNDKDILLALLYGNFVRTFLKKKSWDSIFPKDQDKKYKFDHLYQVETFKIEELRSYVNEKLAN
eukprot:TRINITY_DN22623_c0_g1_i1.p1 TRINITY_DN22623_c0_g1~~TRINITY_DN22623_c0_g1_i1.p1  ORF type:complete len:228 (+),score=50.20 TRINITY_DN22623_c0_g1_i1:89-772(+)